MVLQILGFSGGSDSKESACNAADLDSIPGSGRSPGEGNGYSLQYFCERSLVGYSPWVSKSRTRLSDKHIDFESVQLCIVIDLVILFLVLCNI